MSTQKKKGKPRGKPWTKEQAREQALLREARHRNLRLLRAAEKGQP